MRELLLGNEAVAMGAIDAGIRGAYSYPGTPATEIFETIERRADLDRSIVARWSVNEKVAYEEAMGMSFVGGRAIVCMKHVGLNVAADPFMSSALTGADAGFVLVVADDPGMHSSQNEQDTRFYGEFARLPVFEPSNQQEAYDMTREAFEFSERAGIPVILRLVTRLAHSRSAVERSRPSPIRNEPTHRGDPNQWTLLPVNARRRFRRLIELQPRLQEHSEKSAFNRLNLRGPTGILATGIAHNYVREVIGDDPRYSVLKIGVHPVPAALVRRLVDHCNRILVAEDGFPLVEGKLVGLLGVPGKTIDGRLNGALPPDGELTADLIRAGLGLAPPPVAESILDLPARPPMLCQGCPHCDTFRVILDAVGEGQSPILFSDIGCYTLGAFPPYNAVHACVDMGASISMAYGAAMAGAHPVVCTIGDSTFAHSGMPPLLAAAKDNANMTVVILDNAIVAMTGGQRTFVTGDEFIRLLRGLGVDTRHIIPIDPLRQSQDKNVELMRREIDYRGLSVVIASRPCIHIKRRSSESEPAATAALV